jgi:hypothetical protein
MQTSIEDCSLLKQSDKPARNIVRQQNWKLMEINNCFLLQGQTGASRGSQPHRSAPR